MQKNVLDGINSYGKQLTEEEIASKAHRNFVGGMWEQVGKLQFDFLVEQGLKPSHTLADVGCGCLRGGIHYIKYLERANYHGLDINPSLIKAGWVEVKEAGLENKLPNLLVDDQFKLDKFGKKFDFMVSVSLFTHLPMNMIIRCLSEARNSLKPDGVYFSTFFQAPRSAYLDKLLQQPGGKITHYDADPYHYSFEELSWMGDVAGLTVRLMEHWDHPRNQKMAAFLPKE